MTARRSKHAVKLVMIHTGVTRHGWYRQFDIWLSWNVIFLKGGGMRFLKQCLQALLPAPSPIFFLPDPARPAPAFLIVPTDWEPPGTGYYLSRTHVTLCKHPAWVYQWMVNISVFLQNEPNELAQGLSSARWCDTWFSFRAHQLSRLRNWYWVERF